MLLLDLPPPILSHIVGCLSDPLDIVCVACACKGLQEAVTAASLGISFLHVPHHQLDRVRQHDAIAEGRNLVSHF